MNIFLNIFIIFKFVIIVSCEGPLHFINSCQLIALVIRFFDRPRSSWLRIVVFGTSWLVGIQ
jgi:hypothetical protein